MNGKISQEEFYKLHSKPSFPDKNRLIVAQIGLSLIFLLIIIRMMMLAYSGVPDKVKGLPDISSLIDNLQNYDTSNRAEVIDSEGNILITTLPIPSVYADPSKVDDPQEYADKLISVMPELDRESLITRLSAGNRFTWIKRQITPELQAKILNLGLPAVHFREESKRFYPSNHLFSHALGYVDIDGKGMAGVERALQPEILDYAKKKEPLQLSLDLAIQNIVRSELIAGMEKFQAIGAAGIIINAKNGEVVAMVSLPDFDPNDAGSSGDALFNRATLGIYELGSIFKAFTIAGILEYGAATLDKRYDATNPLQYGRHQIRDFKPQRRWMDLMEVFVHSSNIGTALAALDLGTPRFLEFIKKLGLLAPLPIEISDKAMPQIPSPWGEINTVTSSFGHGISVTPMHAAQATAALVNGGILYPATLLKGKNKEGVRVMSKEVSDKIRMLFRLTVKFGTASQAEIVGYNIGGKTGTAQKISEFGRYMEGVVITSFIGAFPMDDPQYVVLVMLDEPQKLKETHGYNTAGWNAVPITGQIISRIASVKGIPPRIFDMPEVMPYIKEDFDKTGKKRRVIETEPESEEEL